MRVFLISNMYPSQKNKSFGVFVQNTVHALEESGVVFSKKSVLRGRSNGNLMKVIRYLYYYTGIIFHYIFGKFDVVYVHFLSHNTPVLYLILKVFGKKKQWVINVHGSDVVQSKGRKIDSYNYLVLKASDLVIAPSSAFVEQMQEQYPSLEISKYYVSPSGGINSSVFYPSITTCKENNTPTLGFVSRIDPGKGWEVFLEAVNRLNKQDIPTQIIIAGGGSEVDELNASILRLGLEHQVTYLGNQTQQELGNVYRRLDLFVFPSLLDESLGLVAIEAMACGVPVVGSEIPSIKTYLEHQENGFCFEPGNIEDLVHQIKCFLKLSEEKRRNMVELAINVGHLFDSQNVNSRLLDKFKSLLTNNNNRNA